MKKGTIIILLIILVISILVVLIIINESYKMNSGYLTLWGAKELLSYFGSVISAIGTIFIGIIAFKQNNKANEINDRLLKIQEINSTPFLHIEQSSSKIQCFRDREIDILLGLKNNTNGIINIIEVSEIKIKNMIGSPLEIPFCSGWTSHYSVIPHQSLSINFLKESGRNEEPIIDISNYGIDRKFIQLICAIEIRLQFVNSSDIYRQKIEFYVHLISLKDDEYKYRLDIFNIENSIEREKDN